MFCKVVSVSLKINKAIVYKWHEPGFFETRSDYFKNTELKAISEEKEKNYLALFSEIEQMYNNPSVDNIQKLISPKHLGRRLIDKNIGIRFNVDNHFGQLELMTLEETLLCCWEQMTDQQKQDVISFAISKTKETLGSHAECFTLSLRDFVYGLIELDPTTRYKLMPVVQQRRNFYRSW